MDGVPRTVSSLIAGRPDTDAPGGTFDVPNPARLDEIGRDRAARRRRHVRRRLPRGREAQAAWARVPAPTRGRAIQILGRLVEDNAEALARLITREIGKPIAEARG